MNGNRALVIGAGFTGLLAARVLSEHCSEVIICERDVLAPDTKYRPGLPQARHSHGMLAKGSALLRGYFPGLRAALSALGAPVFDVGSGTKVKLPTGWAPRVEVGIEMQSHTRAALDMTIRNMVSELPNVHIMDGFTVDGLTWNTDRKGVTGLTGRHNDQIAHLEADLVIDCSGRGSRIAGWLADAGYADVTVEKSTGKLGYATRMYRSPYQPPLDWYLSIETTVGDKVQRGGMVSIVEGGYCLVSVRGSGGNQPLGGQVDFERFASTLGNPDIHETIRIAEPVGDIYRIPNRENRRYRFDKIVDWPQGFAVMGDALCALNSTHGQGMTVGVLQAQTLQQLLETTPLRYLGSQFNRKNIQGLARPWLISSSSSQNPEKEPLYARMARSYFEQATELAPSNPALYRRLLMTQNMLSNPTTMMNPTVMGRILAHAAGKKILPKRRKGA